MKQDKTPKDSRTPKTLERAKPKAKNLSSVMHSP
jgi:hypothetical protein